MQQIFDFLLANEKIATALTAIAALFVSLLSMLLACMNLWMQRTHNRKSVLPVGHITVGDYEDEISVRLCNDGVGPLIVDKVSVFQNDEERDSKTSIIEFMPALPGDYAWATFAREIKGRAISPAEEITLISLKGFPEQEDFEVSKVIVRRILSTMTVKIECKNIYDEKMPTVSRNLPWFGRTL